MPFKNPKKRREYDRLYKRNQRRGTSSPSPLVVPAPVRIRRAVDVQKLIEKAAVLVENDPEARPIEKGRAMAQVAGVALRALETADLEGRVERLEALLRMKEERAV